MKRIYNNKTNSYITTIYQGELFIGYRGEIISTVLGSCIAVCIFDKKRSIGGLNHAILPMLGLKNDLNKLNYTDFSTNRLIEQFLLDGSKISNLKAKVFGGSDIGRYKSIGEKNIKSAMDVLKSKNIEVVGSDIGGYVSRKLFYFSSENRVFIKIDRLSGI